MTMPGGSAATTLAPVVLTANTAQYNAQMQVAAGHTSKLTSLVSDLSKHLDGLSGKAGRKLLHISGQEVAMLTAYTATAATFEKQMSTLRASAAITGESFKGIKSGVESAFNKFPVARSDVIALTETISELGITGTKSVASLTETFIKMGAATGEPMQELASSVIQLSKLMGNENAQVIGRYANALTVASKNAGVSATNVAQFGQAIAPMARMAGIGETGVIGISTAFAKAGADGYVAANTFNSMMGDITNSMATQSPELAKYANLIGVTTDQFAKMDKAQAFTKVIEAIAKQGPAGIDTLNRLGFEGVRAQAAITALAQSGDLQKQLSIATGNAGGTQALDKGSSAAFNNLADSAARTRNSMTQLATGVGTTLTGPLNAGLKGVNALFGGFNKLFTGLTPIHGLFTMLITALTAFAGVALVSAAAIGKMAMASYVARSSPLRALFAGMRMGPREGPAPPMYPWAAPFYTAGRRIGSIPMQIRGAMGAPLPGEPGGGPVPEGYVRPPWYQRMGGQALRLPIWLARTQTEFLREATRPGEERQAPFMGAAWRRMVDARARITGVPAPEVMPGQLPPERAGLFSRMGAFFTGMGKGFGGQSEVQAATKANVAATNALAAAEREAAAAAGKGADIEAKTAAQVAAAQEKLAATTAALEAAEKKAAAGVVSGSKESLLASRQTGALAGATAKMYATSLGAGAKMGGQLLGGALKSVGGMLFNPWMLAMFTAPMAYSFFKDRMNRGDRSVNDVQAVQAYNDQLGITTQQVADLGSAAADTATALLGTTTAATPMNQAATFTQGQANAAVGQKATDQYLLALARTPGGKENTRALAQLFSTYGFTDPRALKLAQQQASLYGWSPDVITKASQLAVGGGTPGAKVVPRYGDLAKQIMSSEGISKGWASFMGIATSASKSGEDLSHQAVVSIQKEFQTNTQLVGPVFAAAKQLAEQYKLLNSMAQQVTTGSKGGLQVRQIGETIHQMIGGDTSAYQKALAPLAQGITTSTTTAGRPVSELRTDIGSVLRTTIPAGQDPKKVAEAALRSGRLTIGQEQLVRNLLQQPGGGVVAGTTTTTTTTRPQTPRERSETIFKAFQATDEGKAYIKNLREQGVKLDPAHFQQQISSFYKFGAGGETAFSQLGEIGRFATRNKQFQDSLTSQDPTKVQHGLDELGKKAMALGGGFAGANAKLEELKAAAGSTSSALYQRADAEQQILKERAQYWIQQQGPKQQAQYYGEQYRQAVVAVQQHPGTGQAAQDAQDQLKAAEADWQNFAENQRQTMIGMIQTTIAANNQMADAEVDFGLQMKHAQRDYNNQRLRSNRDFTLQMQHMNRDYHQQVVRAERDFGIQLQRETMQASETEYNPFQRIQAQFTENAGTVLLLMQEQNQAIQGQYTNLQKVKNMGLSQKAIDTMQLADPNNAQQLDTLVTSLSADPKLVAQINAAVATRVSATGRLVHSQFSETFRNTTQDFRNRMHDAAVDINNARSDAKTAQANALSDAAKDYQNFVSDAGQAHKNAMDRAGRDLKEALTVYTGNISQVYKTLMQRGLDDLAKWSPAAYQVAVSRINQLRAVAPQLFETHPPGGQYRQGISDAPGRGSVGYFRTPKGNIGYYDPNTGRPVQLKGATLANFERDNNTNLLPVIRNAGFQYGGISTHRQLAWVSETGQPEIHLPMRGQATIGVFADIVQAVSREVGMAMRTHGHGVRGQGVSIAHVNIDKSTQFNGEIKVCADDPNRMAKELADKARLAKLTRPNYRAGG